MQEPKTSDAAAVAFLKWMLAALLLLNGAALVIAFQAGEGRGGWFGGSRWNYAAGLVCALAGALCWALSHGSISNHDAEDEWSGASSRQPGSRDQAIAFGALAIMLWVASLTTFVTGCEHMSWTPAGDRSHKLLHPAGGPDGHRALPG